MGAGGVEVQWHTLSSSFNVGCFTFTCIYSIDWQGAIFDEIVCIEERGHEYGTEGRNRTGTSVRKPDFESGASTSSATPAYMQRAFYRK